MYRETIWQVNMEYMPKIGQVRYISILILSKTNASNAVIVNACQHNIKKQQQQQQQQQQTIRARSSVLDRVINGRGY